VAQIIFANDRTKYIVCGNKRVFKFTPDGKSSELKLPFSPAYIRVLSSNSQVLYAVAIESILGVRSFHGSLYKSEDGGFSWIKIEMNEKLEERAKREWGGWSPPGWYSIDLLAVDSQSPNTFYITVGPEDDSRGAIFKTSDGGKTWLDITDNIGFVPISIVIDPSNSNVLYAPGHKLLRSNDGGKTWKSIEIPVDTYINDISISENLLYIATNKGIYRSSDSGKTWQSLNDGLLETNIREVMASSDMVLAEGEETGIYKLMK